MRQGAVSRLALESVTCITSLSSVHFVLNQNIIFKNTQKLEELKSQLNWDQQALEAWLEESARKDEDAMTLAKYTKMDDAKVKVLLKSY